MIFRRTPKSVQVQVNRAQLAVIGQLGAEFPDLPRHLIYEKVHQARARAAKELPNVAAYTTVLERETRALIVAASARSTQFDRSWHQAPLNRLSRRGP
jgi:hypothetical protein